MRNLIIHSLVCTLFLSLAWVANAQVPYKEHPGTVKVLALGDSMTVGVTSESSYRYYLWKLLIDRGVCANFVGSMEFSGTRNEPNFYHKGNKFDPNHFSDWGWTSTQLLEKLPNEFERLGDNIPDVVFLHIGSNDIFQNPENNTPIQNIKLIIEFLRSKNPKVQIAIAQIFPSAALNVIPLNQKIADLSSLSTPSSPITIADLTIGIDPLTDSDDMAHPNNSGAIKMAENWMRDTEQFFDDWIWNYKSFESYYFPGTRDTSLLDNDHDGLSNLIEYCLGSHPLESTRTTAIACTDVLSNSMDWPWRTNISDVRIQFISGPTPSPNTVSHDSYSTDFAELRVNPQERISIEKPSPTSNYFYCWKLLLEE